MTDPIAGFLAPHEAYNMYLNSSVVVLDACATREPVDERSTSVTDSNQSADDSEEEELPTLPAAWAQAENVGILQRTEGVIPGVMQGSAWLDPTLPLSHAATLAYDHVREEMTPDDLNTALVLFDERERAELLALWLIGEGRCRRVFASERAAQ